MLVCGMSKSIWHLAKDETSDLWSAGCIIAMLYLGQRPFTVHEDMEHLAMMERILDREIPHWMARQAVACSEMPEGVVFREDGALDWPAKAPEKEAVERVTDLQRLRDQVQTHHTEFLAVLLGLLEIDPQKRLAAAAALQSPFFTEEGLKE
mmetsp:Transcript_46036/g.106293  ORF Transcript_46036/g.106293 Transcript_46036/m.106293 type:complete len:151 (+) Transcript_46036:101-553(+)